LDFGRAGLRDALVRCTRDATLFGRFMSRGREGGAGKLGGRWSGTLATPDGALRLDADFPVPPNGIEAL
jgi:hypothetical protein